MSTTHEHDGRWHVDESTLTRYAQGLVGDVTTRASIESHLVSCSRCVEALATHADVDVAAGWQSIEHRLSDASFAAAHGHGMLRMALATRRLSAVTGSISALLIVGAILMGVEDRGALAVAVILLGPLAPASVAAVAYTTWIDPVGIVARASPMADRLPFVRALIASSVALMVAVLASPWLGLGADGLLALGLPAIALDLTVLAAARWVDPWKAAIALSALWSVAVLDGVRWNGSGRARLVDLVTTSATAQLSCAVVAAIAAAVVVQSWRTDVYGVAR